MTEDSRPSTEKTVHVEVVEAGDSLPCHKSNILHTEGVRKTQLGIWYVE